MPAHKKNILISLCGTSPAVITEAIWALAEQNIALHEVVVITTLQGKERINCELFGKSKQVDELRKEITPKFGQEFSNFKFSGAEKYIKLIPNADESEDSSDIVNTDDTIPTSDCILETLRKYTERDDTVVYFSIAGGRKSMTAMGALCLSLVGRQQDELCHVLVNDKLVFAQPSFYFPSQRVHTYHNRTTGVREEINGFTATTTLSKIPYVRIRNLFQEKFNTTPTYYSELVEQANSIVFGEKSKKKLKIDTKKWHATIDGIKIQLTMQRLAALFTMAKSKAPLNSHEFEDRAYELLDSIKEGSVNLDIREQLNSLNIKNIKRVVSELKNNYLQQYDIMLNTRGYYGLDFDKVEVTIS